MSTCITDAQEWALQHPIMNWKGAGELPQLLEDLLTVNGFSGEVEVIFLSSIAIIISIMINKIKHLYKPVRREVFPFFTGVINSMLEAWSFLNDF